MIEFEEPEKGYVFEGSNFTKNKPKARLIVLLLSFSFVIGFLIKNDYNFNFFEKNRIVVNFKCSDESIISQHDTMELNYQKAVKSLDQNMSLLKSEKKFENSQVLYEENLEANRKKPVVNLYFSGETNLEIPDRMCGFKVNVFYK